LSEKESTNSLVGRRETEGLSWVGISLSTTQENPFQKEPRREERTERQMEGRKGSRKGPPSGSTKVATRFQEKKHPQVRRSVSRRRKKVAYLVPEKKRKLRYVGRGRL